MPTSCLPSDPNLEHLKKQAKTLLRLVRTGDAKVLAAVREHHPRLGDDPATFTLADAQLVTARQYGFASWPKLRQHIELVTQYSRWPHRQQIGGELRSAADLADEFLRLACLNYGEDDPARREAAWALLADHPEVATANIYTMAAVGEVAAAADLLAANPALARAEGGPFRWEPLMYVAYSRLDSTQLGHSTLEVARLLVDHGADPNVGYLWEGLTSPFTALTGAFGRGEGNAPPHEYRLELARLLLDAGADPNDPQTLYNCGLGGPVDDRAHLELLLEYGLGRDAGGPWYARLGHTIPTPAQLLENELLASAMDDRPERIRLLLDHDVDLDGLGTEHPIFEGHNAFELAILGGNTEVAELLAAAGAKSTLDPVQSFLAACMRVDRAEVDRLLAADPSLLDQAIAREPHLIIRAAEGGRLEAVRLLAALGFDVNALRRTSPLHEAAWRGDLAMVRALVELGADPTLRDPSYDSTPQGWAEHNDQHEVVEYLAALHREPPT